MSWRNQQPANARCGQHFFLVLKVSLLLVGITSCSSSNSDTQSAEETISIEVVTTTVVTSTTLSVAEQTASDEQLMREMLYSGQQEFLQATGTKNELVAYLRWEIEHMFPPYREFITDSVLEKCISTTETFPTAYGTIELGSSFLTPDWKFEVANTSKTFQPSEYGRTYLVRATFVNSEGKKTESDIHYTVIDGRAYWFPDYDYCL